MRARSMSPAGVSGMTASSRPTSLVVRPLGRPRRTVGRLTAAAGSLSRTPMRTAKPYSPPMAASRVSTVDGAGWWPPAVGVYAKECTSRGVAAPRSGTAQTKRLISRSYVSRVRRLPVRAARSSRKAATTRAQVASSGLAGC